MFSFLFSAKGRISRSQFWLRWFRPFSLILVISAPLIAVAAGGITALGRGTDQGAIILAFVLSLLVFPLLFFLMAWSLTVVLIKRIHDRNKSGWLILAIWVPAAFQFAFAAAQGSISTAIFSPHQDSSGIATSVALIQDAVFIWLFIEFGCMRGTIGPNQYGPDPI